MPTFQSWSLSSSEFLFVVAIEGYVARFNQFLDEPDVDVNYRGDNGHSVLMKAACYKAESADPGKDQDPALTMVRALLEKGKSKGLNLEATTRRGGPTALLLAAEVASVATAEELIKAGANIRYLTDQGNGALHFAAHNGSPDMTRMLLSHGLKMDARNRNGTTPLMIAARHGVAGTVELLLREGSDPHATDLTHYKDVCGWAAANERPGQAEEITRIVRKWQQSHSKRELADPAAQQQGGIGQGGNQPNLRAGLQP